MRGAWLHLGSKNRYVLESSFDALAREEELVGLNIGSRRNICARHYDLKRSVDMRTFKRDQHTHVGRIESYQSFRLSKKIKGLDRRALSRTALRRRECRPVLWYN